MTYKNLYEKAETKLEKGEITSGEFDEMTKPLDEEIRPQGEWSGEPERRKMVTRVCTACGERSAVGYFCMWCGADMGYSPSKESSPSEDCKKRGDQVVDWFLQGFNEAMEAKEGEEA